MPEKALTEQCAWLIETFQRAGRLPEFLSLLQEKRPQYDWQKPIIPTPKDLRNRDNLLQNIKSTWIEGFLHQSLSQAITLELNLSYQPEAVARKSLYSPGQSSEAPIEQSLQEVFQKYGRSLLILGEPGSGKTITLLQLAETLITAAQHDPSRPVPVILNLSSWVQQKQPLQEWLVEELFLQYGMSRKLSKTWITQNLLLYLLDGLDEVAAEARDACVQAINHFKAEHPAELVVCSRLADYEQLKEKLNVATAVRLHPLTDDQIQTYLSHPELELTAVRDALATDPNLNELAHSPLFLNIMTLAYRGFTREQLQSFGTLANRRKHLFGTYVDEMFKRRPLPNDASYALEQTLHSLANLAHGMKYHNQSTFYIEHLQPTWLSKHHFFLYKLLVGFIVGSLTGAILTTLFIISEGIFEISSTTDFIIFNSIAGGIGGLFGSSFVAVFRFKNKFIRFMVSAFGTWLYYWQMTLSIGSRHEQFAEAALLSLVLSIVFGSILAINIGLINYNSKIILYEAVRFSSPSKQDFMRNVRKGLVIGAAIAIVLGIIVGTSFAFGLSLNNSDQIALLGGFIWGAEAALVALVGGFIFVLISTMIEPIEVQLRNKPNQGVRESLLNATILSIVFGISSYILGISFDAFFGTKPTVSYLAMAFVIPSSFLYYGGSTVIKHSILRLTVAVDLRLKLATFLDKLTERSILHRVGGGWIFIHRTLLEYFAALHPDAQPPAGSV